MFRYSRNYFPSAPMAQIFLRHPAGTRSVGPLSALLDTGADATIIPLRYLDEIEASATDEMFLRSPWGERRSVWMYRVDLQIGEVVLSETDVIGDDVSDEVILGRDALNLLRILLDGPRETVEVLE